MTLVKSQRDEVAFCEPRTKTTAAVSSSTSRRALAEASASG